MSHSSRLLRTTPTAFAELLGDACKKAEMWKLRRTATPFRPGFVGGAR